jgi:hypothetical protein
MILGHYMKEGLSDFVKYKTLYGYSYGGVEEKHTHFNCNT